ncbi:MAG: DEAD/DEAH box helicase family protein [Dehalococcoidia bacterium]
MIGVSTPDSASPENLRHDPARFASEALRADLWDKQREILSAVANHKRVAVRSCNGSGKTFTAAYVVIWWLVTQTESIVITTATTAHQVRNILWREIRRIYHSNAALIGGKLSNTSIELDDKHFAVGLSTDQPERF